MRYSVLSLLVLASLAFADEMPGWGKCFKKCNEECRPFTECARSRCPICTDVELGDLPNCVKRNDCERLVGENCFKSVPCSTCFGPCVEAVTEENYSPVSIVPSHLCLDDCKVPCAAHITCMRDHCADCSAADDTILPVCAKLRGCEDAINANCNPSQWCDRCTAKCYIEGPSNQYPSGKCMEKCSSSCTDLIECTRNDCMECKDAGLLEIMDCVKARKNLACNETGDNCPIKEVCDKCLIPCMGYEWDDDYRPEEPSGACLDECETECTSEISCMQMLCPACNGKNLDKLPGCVGMEGCNEIVNTYCVQNKQCRECVQPCLAKDPYRIRDVPMKPSGACLGQCQTECFDQIQCVKAQCKPCENVAPTEIPRCTRKYNCDENIATNCAPSQQCIECATVCEGDQVTDGGFVGPPRGYCLNKCDKKCMTEINCVKDVCSQCNSTEISILPNCVKYYACDINDANCPTTPSCSTCMGSCDGDPYEILDVPGKPSGRCLSKCEDDCSQQITCVKEQCQICSGLDVIDIPACTEKNNCDKAIATNCMPSKSCQRCAGACEDPYEAMDVPGKPSPKCLKACESECSQQLTCIRSQCGACQDADAFDIPLCTAKNGCDKAIATNCMPSTVCQTCATNCEEPYEAMDVPEKPSPLCLRTCENECSEHLACARDQCPECKGVDVSLMPSCVEKNDCDVAANCMPSTECQTCATACEESPPDQKPTGKCLNQCSTECSSKISCIKMQCQQCQSSSALELVNCFSQAECKDGDVTANCPLDETCDSCLSPCMGEAWEDEDEEDDSKPLPPFKMLCMNACSKECTDYASCLKDQCPPCSDSTYKEIHGCMTQQTTCKNAMAACGKPASCYGCVSDCMTMADECVLDECSTQCYVEDSNTSLKPKCMSCVRSCRRRKARKVKKSQSYNVNDPSSGISG